MTTIVDGTWIHCPTCGTVYRAGQLHQCSGYNPSTTGYHCSLCGQWVMPGCMHICTYSTPTCWPAPSCSYCYCIDVAPLGERTKPHHRCCKCGDVRLA